jgi:hypothetical protein
MDRFISIGSLVRLGLCWSFLICIAHAGAQATIYSLPASNDRPNSRSLEIEQTRNDFLYGPGSDGQGPPSPSGPLGMAFVAVDSGIVNTEAYVQLNISQHDYAAAKDAEVKESSSSQ